MGDSLDEQKKLILPLLQRADEIGKVEPKVAYYCRLYAVQTMHNRRPEITDVIKSLLVKLEKDKASVAPNADDDKQYCETFARTVFSRADRADRAGRATTATAMSFYAATIFFEILKQFGPLAEDVQDLQRYAVWKAADIRKALREGRTPTPGSPGGQELLAAADNAGLAGEASAAQPFGRAPSADEEPQAPPTQGSAGFAFSQPPGAPVPPSAPPQLGRPQAGPSSPWVPPGTHDPVAGDDRSDGFSQSRMAQPPPPPPDHHAAPSDAAADDLEPEDLPHVPAPAGHPGSRPGHALGLPEGKPFQPGHRVLCRVPGSLAPVRGTVAKVEPGGNGAVYTVALAASIAQLVQEDMAPEFEPGERVVYHAADGSADEVSVTQCDASHWRPTYTISLPGGNIRETTDERLTRLHPLSAAMSALMPDVIDGGPGPILVPPPAPSLPHEDGLPPPPTATQGMPAVPPPAALPGGAELWAGGMGPPQPGLSGAASGQLPHQPAPPGAAGPFADAKPAPSLAGSLSGALPPGGGHAAPASHLAHPPPPAGVYPSLQPLAPPAAGIAAAPVRHPLPSHPATPPVSSVPVPQPGFVPDLVAITDAQKCAKYAASSLGFEDVPTAVKYLTEALQLLTQPAKAGK